MNETHPNVDDVGADFEDATRDIDEVTRNFEDVTRDIDEVTRSFAEALIAAYKMSCQAESSYERADPELTRQFCSELVNYLDLRAAHALASRDRIGAGERLVEDDPGEGTVEGRVQESGNCIGFLRDMVDCLETVAIDTYHQSAPEARAEFS